MDISIRDSFDISLKILSTLRLYPSHKSQKLNRIQAYSGLFFAVPYLILNFLYFLFGEEMDQTQFNLNMIVLAELMGMIPKLLTFIRRELDVKKCLHYFDTFHFAMLEEDLEMIIKESVKASRRNSKLILGLVVAIIFCFSIRPLIMTKIMTNYMLPIEIWLPFNVESGFRYYLVYIYQVMAGAYLAIAGVIVDPLIGGLIHQAVTHLVILQINLQNLTKYAKEEFSTINNCKSIQKTGDFSIPLYNKIKECIRYYDSVLRFIENVGECFSFAVFGQLATSVIVFCFSCVQISIASSLLNFEAFTCLGVAVLVLGQIYFYCYYGTLLYEENKKLIDAIYSTEWYEFDIKSRKALLIMMERSKKPVILTAGKILELSLDTFTAVIKRSYSLLAVVKNYQ